MARGYVRLIAVAGWMLVVAPVYAEVMDKEPTVTANWLWAVAGGLIAILAWRWRWWLGAAVSTLALGGVWLMHLEIADPSIGRAIRLEAGADYVVHFYWSAAAAIVLHLVAVYSGLRRHLTPRNYDVRVPVPSDEPLAGPPLFVVVSALGVAFFITDVIMVASEVYLWQSWDVVLGDQNSAFANTVVAVSVPVTVVATAASVLGILPLRRWMTMAPWKPTIIAGVLAGGGARLLWLLPSSGLDVVVRRLLLLSAPPVAFYCFLAVTKWTTSRDNIQQKWRRAKRDSRCRR